VASAGPDKSVAEIRTQRNGAAEAPIGDHTPPARPRLQLAQFALFRVCVLCVLNFLRLCVLCVGRVCGVLRSLRLIVLAIFAFFALILLALSVPFASVVFAVFWRSSRSLR
jgi:hypothetical protein